MKPRDFVKKHNLTNGYSPSDPFWSDFKLEFMMLLELGKAKENLKGYNNAINALRSKWDGIKAKSGNSKINEKAWNYFYATVVAPIRQSLFPKEMASIDKEREERKKVKLDRKAFYESIDNSYDNFFDNMFHNLLNSMLKGIDEREIDISFELLDLQRDASHEEVKASFRKLSKIHHPDMGGNRAKFEMIITAKNICLATFEL